MTPSDTPVEMPLSDHRTEHGSLRIERLLDAAPSRVYAAFATAEGKARWFSGPQAQVLVREFDFRPGGRERLYCQWPPGAHGRHLSVRTSDFRAAYLDIVPERRILYAYEMYLDERKISVSLATVQFQPHGRGTRLIITEQGAFLDGFRDEGSREQGTDWLTDQLAASLGVAASRVLRREITLTRLLRVPRELVFQAWTDPQHLVRWFGPAGFTVTHCQVQLRVGGRWSLTLRADDELAALVGRDHPVGGEYLEVEAPGRLVFTNNALDAAGNALFEGLTTVTFEDLGGMTRLTVRTHASGTGEHVAAMLAGMEQGWSESLEKLGAEVRRR